jgi:hypothetical protein
MKKHKLAQLQRWMKAFGPLFDMKRRKRGSKECLAVAAMRAQYLTGYIGLKALGTMKETDYDEYLEKFRELTDLCHELVWHAPVPEATRDGDGDGEAFLFDMQWVMPLDFTAKKCRNPALRRRAIRLLKARPRRELFWDSVIAVKVCEWVVNVEEEGLAEGVVREENRARRIGIGLDLRSGDEVRSAKVWCTLGTGERREGVVQW